MRVSASGAAVVLAVTYVAQAAQIRVGGDHGWAVPSAKLYNDINLLAGDSLVSYRLDVVIT